MRAIERLYELVTLYDTLVMLSHVSCRFATKFAKSRKSDFLSPVLKMILKIGSASSVAFLGLILSGFLRGFLVVSQTGKILVVLLVKVRNRLLKGHFIGYSTGRPRTCGCGEREKYK